MLAVGIVGTYVTGSYFQQVAKEDDNRWIR